MTRFGIMGLAVATALVVGAPAKSWALAPQAAITIGLANVVEAQAAGVDQPQAPAAPAAGGDQNAAAGGDSGGLSDATKQGIGCLATSGVSVGYATFWAGAGESLMIVAGGLLAPSMSSTLWLGLASTLVAATCSLGATATPVVLWAVEQKDNIAANLAWHAQETGNELATLFAAPTKAAPHQFAERAQ